MPLFLLFGLMMLNTTTARADDIAPPITANAAQFVKLSLPEKKEALMLSVEQDFSMLALYRYRLMSVANYAANIQHSKQDMHQASTQCQGATDDTNNTDNIDVSWWIHFQGSKFDETETSLWANLDLAKHYFKTHTIKFIDQFQAYQLDNGKRTVHDKKIPTSATYQVWAKKILNSMSDDLSQSHHDKTFDKT